jgi:hypothetical protein
MRVVAHVRNIIGATHDPNGNYYALQYIALATHMPNWQTRECARAAALPGNTARNAAIACDVPFDMRSRRGQLVGLETEVQSSRHALSFAWLDSLFPQCRNYQEELLDMTTRQIRDTPNVLASLRPVTARPGSPTQLDHATTTTDGVAATATSPQQAQKDATNREFTTPPTHSPATNKSAASRGQVFIKTTSLFASPPATVPSTSNAYSGSCGPTNSKCGSATEQETSSSPGTRRHSARRKRSLSTGDM